MRSLFVILILGCIGSVISEAQNTAAKKTFAVQAKVDADTIAKILAKLKKKEKFSNEDLEFISKKLKLSIDVRRRMQYDYSDEDAIVINQALGVKSAQVNAAVKIAPDIDITLGCIQTWKPSAGKKSYPECEKLRGKPLQVIVSIMKGIIDDNDVLQTVYKASIGAVEISADVAAKATKLLADIDVDVSLGAVIDNVMGVFSAASGGIVDAIKSLGVGDITRQLADQVGQILGLLVDLIVQLVCQILGVAPQPVNQALNLGTQILGTGASAVTSLVSSLVPVGLQLLQQALDLLDQVLGQALGALGGIGGGGSPKSPKSPKSSYPTPAPPTPKPY